MKKINQRLNNVVGQINGINRMLESDEEYSKVITQMKAARSALSSCIDKYIHECFDKCVKEGMNQDECKKFFSEIIKNN
jgi:DNA-binding FrmR family transcriptional regulator